MTLSLFAPVVEDGHNRIQPTYVLDVADAVVAALKTADTKGKTYYLGGPEVLTWVCRCGLWDAVCCAKDAGCMAVDCFVCGHGCMLCLIKCALPISESPLKGTWSTGVTICCKPRPNLPLQADNHRCWVCSSACSMRQVYNLLNTVMRMHKDDTIAVPAWMAKLMYAPMDAMRRMVSGAPVPTYTLLSVTV